MSVGMLLPVGPGRAEFDRARLTMRQARAVEPRLGVVVVIDDDAEPRDFGDDPRVRVLRTGLADGRFDAYSAMTAGTLTGLRELGRLGVDAAVKVATDAVVLAPFADALLATLRTTGAGVVGRYRHGPWGDGERDFGSLRRPLLVARLPVRSYRRAGRLRFRVPSLAAQRRVLTVFRAAKANGYETGEHCLGGVYGVSGDLMRRIDEQGLAEHPRDWAGTRLSEDHILGLVARAAGCSLADSQLFGAVLAGLPGAPEQLVKAGFAFTHSVKGDDELELRRRFAELTGTGPDDLLEQLVSAAGRRGEG